MGSRIDRIQKRDLPPVQVRKIARSQENNVSQANTASSVSVPTNPNTVAVPTDPDNSSPNPGGTVTVNVENADGTISSFSRTTLSGVDPVVLRDGTDGANVNITVESQRDAYDWLFS